jgi:hypothetical protein
MPIGAEIMPKMFYNIDNWWQSYKTFFDIIYNTIKVTLVKTIGIMPIVAEIMQRPQDDLAHKH